MTASALYSGIVRHRRFADPPREFSHRLTLAYIDLDELPTLLGGRLARARPGIVRVRRRDLCGAGDGRDPRAAVRELIEERTGRAAPDGPIRVLTHPRTLGACFNPVSFYYAFSADDRLDAVVAEVTNTPWGERHAYVLRDDEPAGVLRGAHPKALHVSPFLGMDHRHEWAVAAPGNTLSLHIEDRAAVGGDLRFDATLSMRRRELTARSVRGFVARHPGGALRVLTLIYGHALALKLRGARHFAHPGPRSA